MVGFFHKLFGSRLERESQKSQLSSFKPKGWLSEEEDQLTPERQLWLDPDEPISHYYRWIWEYLAYLPLLCDV